MSLLCLYFVFVDFIHFVSNFFSFVMMSELIVGHCNPTLLYVLLQFQNDG